MKHFVLVAALSLSAAPFCTVVAAPPAPTPEADAAVREQLAGLERHAGALYAAAREANWPEAKSHSHALVSAVMALENPVDKAQQPLIHTMGKLVRAVRAREGLATMHAANRVLEWAGQRNPGVSGPAAATASAGLAQLEFLARELEIAAWGKDLARSEAMSVKLRDRWAEQRLTLTGRVGASEVDGYDGLILKLAGARSTADFAEAAVALQQATQKLRAALRESGQPSSPLP